MGTKKAAWKVAFSGKRHMSTFMLNWPDVPSDALYVRAVKPQSAAGLGRVAKVKQTFPAHLREIPGEFMWVAFAPMYPTVTARGKIKRLPDRREVKAFATREEAGKWLFELAKKSGHFSLGGFSL